MILEGVVICFLDMEIWKVKRFWLFIFCFIMLNVWLFLLLGFNGILF